MTKQAMILFGVVPLGIAALLIATGRNQPPFRMGILIGIVAGSLFCTGAWWRSVRFEGRHLEEGPAFWAAREAFIRPRFFFGSVFVGGISLVLALLLALAHVVLFAGILVVVSFYCALFVALLWGKIP
jgi:hypothetical protein